VLGLGLRLGLGLDSGVILSVQSNQFCAVHDAICAVQDEKLCSPKTVKLTTFSLTNDNMHESISNFQTSFYT